MWHICDSYAVIYMWSISDLYMAHLWPICNASVKPIYGTFVTAIGLDCDLSVNHLWHIYDASITHIWGICHPNVTHLWLICSDLYISIITYVTHKKPACDNSVICVWPICNIYYTIYNTSLTHLWPICETYLWLDWYWLVNHLYLTCDVSITHL